MNTENKYYVPNIDEFHIGFEYEEKREIIETGHLGWIVIDEVWEKRTFPETSDNTPYQLNRVKELLNPEKTKKYYRFTRDGAYSNECRVKHLDEKDIERLGWIQTKKYSEETIFQLEIDDYLFYELALQQEQIVIEKWYTQKLSAIPKGWASVPIFTGTIKNYNELKKIMQMLNIK